jgi:hypothetical protein
MQQNDTHFPNAQIACTIYRHKQMWQNYKHLPKNEKFLVWIVSRKREWYKEVSSDSIQFYYIYFYIIIFIILQKVFEANMANY